MQISNRIDLQGPTDQLPSEEAKARFHTAKNWNEFKSGFNSHDEALTAYVSVARNLEDSSTATHVLEWRYLYHDSESRKNQFLLLLAAPLGHVITTRNELRFQSLHQLTGSDLLKMRFGQVFRVLAQIVFTVGLLAAGLAFVFGLVLAYLEVTRNSISLIVAGGVLFPSFAYLRVITRSVMMVKNPKLIARDAFVLLSIQKLPE